VNVYIWTAYVFRSCGRTVVVRKQYTHTHTQVTSPNSTSGWAIFFSPFLSAHVTRTPHTHTHTHTPWETASDDERARAEIDFAYNAHRTLVAHTSATTTACTAETRFPSQVYVQRTCYLCNNICASFSSDRFHTRAMIARAQLGRYLRIGEIW